MFALFEVLGAQGRGNALLLILNSEEPGMEIISPGEDWNLGELQ